MPMNDSTKSTIALKRLQGRAHTSNSKNVLNESIPSNVQTRIDRIFQGDIPPSPDSAALYDITDDVVEYVRLELVPDPSATGHAYRAKLPSNYESASSNAKAGTAPWVNDQILSDVAGQIQIVGLGIGGLPYNLKVYRNGDATKGSGDPISPGDVVDWMFDPFNGIFYQEDDLGEAPSAPTYVECFLYIGDMASSGGGGAPAGPQAPIEVSGTVAPLLEQHSRIFRMTGAADFQPAASLPLGYELNINNPTEDNITITAPSGYTLEIAGTDGTDETAQYSGQFQWVTVVKVAADKFAVVAGSSGGSGGGPAFIQGEWDPTPTETPVNTTFSWVAKSGFTADSDDEALILDTPSSGTDTLEAYAVGDEVLDLSSSFERSFRINLTSYLANSDMTNSDILATCGFGLVDRDDYVTQIQGGVVPGSFNLLVSDYSGSSANPRSVMRAQHLRYLGGVLDSVQWPPIREAHRTKGYTRFDVDLYVSWDADNSLVTWKAVSADTSRVVMESGTSEIEASSGFARLALIPNVNPTVDWSSAGIPYAQLLLEMDFSKGSSPLASSSVVITEATPPAIDNDTAVIATANGRLNGRQVLAGDLIYKHNGEFRVLSSGQSATSVSQPTEFSEETSSATLTTPTSATTTSGVFAMTPLLGNTKIYFETTLDTLQPNGNPPAYCGIILNSSPSSIMDASTSIVAVLYSDQYQIISNLATPILAGAWTTAPSPGDTVAFQYDLVAKTGAMYHVHGGGTDSYPFTFSSYDTTPYLEGAYLAFSSEAPYDWEVNFGASPWVSSPVPPYDEGTSSAVVTPYRGSLYITGDKFYPSVGYPEEPQTGGMYEVANSGRHNNIDYVKGTYIWYDGLTFRRLSDTMSRAPKMFTYSGSFASQFEIVDIIKQQPPGTLIQIDITSSLLNYVELFGTVVWSGDILRIESDFTLTILVESYRRRLNETSSDVQAELTCYYDGGSDKIFPGPLAIAQNTALPPSPAWVPESHIEGTPPTLASLASDLELMQSKLGLSSSYATTIAPYEVVPHSLPAAESSVTDRPRAWVGISSDPLMNPGGGLDVSVDIQNFVPAAGHWLIAWADDGWVYLSATDDEGTTNNRSLISTPWVEGKAHAIGVRNPGLSSWQIVTVQEGSISYLTAPLYDESTPWVLTDILNKVESSSLYFMFGLDRYTAATDSSIELSVRTACVSRCGADKYPVDFDANLDIVTLYNSAFKLPTAAVRSPGVLIKKHQYPDTRDAKYLPAAPSSKLNPGSFSLTRYDETLPHGVLSHINFGLTMDAPPYAEDSGISVSAPAQVTNQAHVGFVKANALTNLLGGWSMGFRDLDTMTQDVNFSLGAIGKVSYFEWATRGGYPWGFSSSLPDTFSLDSDYADVVKLLDDGWQMDYSSAGNGHAAGVYLRVKKTATETLVHVHGHSGEFRTEEIDFDVTLPLGSAGERVVLLCGHTIDGNINLALYHDLGGTADVLYIPGTIYPYAPESDGASAYNPSFKFMAPVFSALLDGNSGTLGATQCTLDYDTVSGYPTTGTDYVSNAPDSFSNLMSFNLFPSILHDTYAVDQLGILPIPTYLSEVASLRGYTYAAEGDIIEAPLGPLTFNPASTITLPVGGDDISYGPTTISHRILPIAGKYKVMSDYNMDDTEYMLLGAVEPIPADSHVERIGSTTTYQLFGMTLSEDQSHTVGVPTKFELSSSVVAISQPATLSTELVDETRYRNDAIDYGREVEIYNPADVVAIINPTGIRFNGSSNFFHLPPKSSMFIQREYAFDYKVRVTRDKAGSRTVFNNTTIVAKDFYYERIEVNTAGGHDISLSGTIEDLGDVIGREIVFDVYGANDATFVAINGATIDSSLGSATVKSAGNFARVIVKYVGSGEYLIRGDIVVV